MKEFVLTVMLCAAAGCTHTQPFFVPGHEPTPSGAVWEPVDNMSDEFDGDALDTTKWQAGTEDDLPEGFHTLRTVSTGQSVQNPQAQRSHSTPQRLGNRWFGLRDG